MGADVPAGKDKKSGPDEWEINNWADSIVRAEEIKADPKKMKHVHPILAKKKAALDNLPIKTMDELKAKAKKMPFDPQEEAAEGE